MVRPESEEQARIYQQRADEYDELICAEDADGELPRELARRVPLSGAVLVDVGAGTGRIARLLSGSVAHVHLVERAAPMLALAERRLAENGIQNFTAHLSDVRELPLADASADVAIAAWVFGHFRSWMPETWRTDVDEALAEMRRVLRPGGHRVLVESLGTGHETPRKNEPLDEYFEFLERRHGFERSVIRTDYVFPDVDTTARIAGGFFGDAMAKRIRENAWARLPECTAVFVSRG
ncbi:MAG: class I SAM-dependent methyltransferase [Myxococcales bacterium]|nr:class I SAM-dependent methyltransferase [Myxococcales bacterium]